MTIVSKTTASRNDNHPRRSSSSVAPASSSSSSSSITLRLLIFAVLAFLLGCVVATSLILNLQLGQVVMGTEPITLALQRQRLDHQLEGLMAPKAYDMNGAAADPSSRGELSIGSILRGQRILVAIAAFDFSQIPHLEEVLEGYHDLCTAQVAKVDVVIHATVAYPVTLIDLLNTRFPCPNFSITIVLKTNKLRLHLVDCHRALFYERINDYDLFIYTEDDIRVHPSTVATYLYETKQIENMLQTTTSQEYKPSDFNVGIVRYEYNYPTNVIIDDNTRHATQNVTRVYWEHSGYERPVVPNIIEPISQQHPKLQERYFTMKNHHQGMFLATQSLLREWKDRPNCHFDQARNRPGRGSQPTEGTQRVWMSSQMLYGKRHCHVQQVLPKDSFGALTVLHLPNKNYRRVGKYRNRTFADGSEVFQKPHESLLTAMETHVALRQAFPPRPQIPYRGITMMDEVDQFRTPLLERRMSEYQAYVDRGGVMTEDDMKKVTLVEDK